MLRRWRYRSCYARPEISLCSERFCICAPAGTPASAHFSRLMDSGVPITCDSLTIFFDGFALRKCLSACRAECCIITEASHGMTVNRWLLRPKQRKNTLHVFIISHRDAILSQVRRCRIMANMPAFQASDASSILATCTKHKHHSLLVSSIRDFLYGDYYPANMKLWIKTLNRRLTPRS